MDKRQWINAISLSVAFIAIWLVFTKWYDKNHPQPVVSPNAQVSTTEPAPAAPATPATTVTAATNPTTQGVITATTGLQAVEAPDTAAPTIFLGSAVKDDPNYALQLALTPVGAGIEAVTLNKFDAPIGPGTPKGQKSPYQFETPLADADSTRVLATRMVAINHKEVDLSGKRWNLDHADAESATFSIFLDDASGHVAKVTKTYHVEKKDSKTGSGGYEVAVTQEIADARPGSAQTRPALDVRAIINGPTPPPSEGDQGIDRSIVTGYVEAKAAISMEPSLLGEFKPEEFSKPKEGDFYPEPTKEPAHTIYTKPFAWIGQTSSYFGAIVLPADPGSPNFNARAVTVPMPSADDHVAALSFETSAPKTAMTVYFGPKWREVLDTPHYESFPRSYNKLLEIKSRMCGWATSDFLIGGLVWILTKFHALFHDWGLAIICLVLIVRTLLHPITKRAQVKMMQMGKLTPEVEKLKKKYADQPEVLNREMMKLYKQQGGAIFGCLPMFLQTPIWIALWSALQGTFELRQAPFLQVYGHSLTWIHDLARPDQLVDLARIFGGPIPLYIFGWHLRAINLLPILMAVVTYVNQKYFMPMPIAATPEQVQQQKMQRGMSLFFPLMFYTMPSGLNLYYLTSMSLGIVESKIIRDHIKEQEEIAKAEGPELVVTKPSRNARQKNDRIVDKTPENPGIIAKIMMAIHKAQEQAEEMRKEKEKDKDKDKNKGKGR